MSAKRMPPTRTSHNSDPVNSSAITWISGILLLSIILITVLLIING